MTKRSIGFSLRSSLWLIPILSLVMSAIAALLLIQLDLRFDPQLRRYWPTFIWAEPDGARQVLSAIASSMITVAGVVFSITMVVLSLSANQYGPRVLRNFMRDRLNQWVLGVFIGAFVYSLLVLQAVSSAATTFVPQLALWAGVALALLAIIFLIAFIHHTAISIQVSEIVAHIAEETITALTALKEISAAGGTAVPLQQNASGNVSILLRMLRLLRQLLEDVKEPQSRATLRKHAHLIGQMAEKTVLIETDLEVVRRALARTLAVQCP